MYRFREIECPNCRHQFIWFEHTYKGSSYILYRRKGYSEQLESTPCPKCNTEMAVLENSITGIDIQSESIEVADIVRGI